MSYSCIWDGFDDYTSTGERWDTISGSPAYNSSYARFPAPPNCVAQGVRFASSGYKTKNYTSNVNGPIASFAFMLQTLPSSGSQGFMGFQDSGTMQVCLAVNANGALEVWRGGSGVSLGTKIATSAPGVISAGTFYFIDFAPTIGTAATVNVYLGAPAGGSPLISVTGVNTQNTANPYANQVIIGFLNGGVSATGLTFDDFHAHDVSGSAPFAVLGEGTRIYTKMPNGAGYATTFTPNGASANWQCVDDVPPDGDTTYVSAGTFPLTEGYAVGAAGFTGTVNGVVRASYVRKDDAGTHTFQNGVRSSSTNSLGTAIAVNSSYAWQQNFFATDPNTSSAWTAAGADAAQPVISAAS